MTREWIEVRLLAPERMQEEAACFLTEFSGRGVIIEEESAPEGGVMIRSYFRPDEFGSWQQAELQEYLRRLGSYGLYPLGLEMRQVATEDWAEAWKAHFKPQKVTSRLVVRPPWEEYAPGPEELVITIYPGMAFGTGRHPTTLLCLKALEEVWGENLPLGEGTWQVLDVGTGTGILALAAARLGAGVLAIDVDPEAVAAAGPGGGHFAGLPEAAVPPDPGQSYGPGPATIGRDPDRPLVERRRPDHLRVPGRGPARASGAVS
jgi:ribosomal protein L11 methyltransferase